MIIHITYININNTHADIDIGSVAAEGTPRAKGLLHALHRVHGVHSFVVASFLQVTTLQEGLLLFIHAIHVCYIYTVHTI